MQHRYLARALAVLLMSLSVASRADELVIVVNKDNAQAMSAATVARIYTGEVLTWENGSAIVVIDQGDTPSSSQFFGSIGKSYANYKAIWTRLMFTGRATPPKSVASDAEVKAHVSANKAAIGYIKASSADDSVRLLR